MSHSKSKEGKAITRKSVKERKQRGVGPELLWLRSSGKESPDGGPGGMFRP